MRSDRETRRAFLLHQDSGLQPERTSLAWGRTLLALMVAACFFLRWMQWQGWLGGRLALSCLLLGAFAWAMQWVRYRAAAVGLFNNSLAPATGSVLVLGLGIGGMSLISLWAVLVTP